eukprot:scaffold139852_cov35-Tisochrysis_lutea.AAC.4
MSMRLGTVAQEVVGVAKAKADMGRTFEGMVTYNCVDSYLSYLVWVRAGCMKQVEALCEVCSCTVVDTCMYHTGIMVASMYARRLVWGLDGPRTMVDWHDAAASIFFHT